MATGKKYDYQFGNEKKFSFQINNNNEIIVYFDNIERVIPGKMARGCFFQSQEYTPIEDDIDYLFNDNIEIPLKFKNATKIRLMLKFTDNHEPSSLSSFFIKWKENDIWDRYPFSMLNMERIYY